MLSRTRSWAPASPGRSTLSRVGLLAVACLVALASLASNAFAAQQPVDLGTAETFGVLAGSTVTNAGFSTVNGDLGVSPGTAVTGFPPGKVNGTTHAADPVAAQAQADLTTAYNDAAGRTPPNALPADVGGQTLIPGVYKGGAALGLTGTVTLDGQGDPSAVFVFQVGSALTTAVGSRVNLTNGAQASNVFWQIGSSATLDTSTDFAGTIMALSSISMNDGVTLNGRALARNGAVTLINDTITAPHRMPIAPPATPPPATPPPATPPPATPPPATPGPGTQPVDPNACTVGASQGRPARPVLRSPRRGARVRAGGVRFRWRASARSNHYILMVDRKKMNTGCATSAVMPISRGQHQWRVIAAGAGGTRSSRTRAFTALAARAAGGPNGCGPAAAWYKKYIPNSVKHLYNFRRACNGHDTCYARQRGKGFCDQGFKKAMYRHCYRRFPHWYQTFHYQGCRQVANLYYKAVHRKGQSAYDNA